MHSIRQKTTLIDVEDALFELSSSDTSSVLRIPSDLRLGGTFGVSGALIQYIATWRRAHPKCVLRAYGDIRGPQAFNSLIDEPHGLAAAYFASRLEDPAGGQVDKRSVLQAAGRQVLAMQQMELRETTGGRAVFLACIAGAKHEFLAPLYSKPTSGGIRSRREFQSLTGRLVAATSPELTRRTSADQIADVSTLIYELFKNTDEHAAHDAMGRRYSWDYPSVRGVLIKYISAPHRAQLSQASSGDARLNLYLGRHFLQSPQVNESRTGRAQSFLELTVFDTGPGLARRWLGRDGRPVDLATQSLDAETAAVLNCFELHASTKPSDGGGIGLDSVVRTLRSLRAFLRLRTGRIALFQDFSGERASFEPNHWMRERKLLADCAGTAFSLVIPIGTTGT